jgi:chromosomal replication initiator protein
MNVTHLKIAQQLEGETGAWRRVCNRLRSELGEAKFSSWFARLDLERVEEGVAYLTVPTKFLRSWIQTHYVDRIRAALQQEMSEVEAISIDIRSNARPAAVRASQPAHAHAPIKPVVAPAPLHAASADKQASNGSPLDRRMTFETFRMGQANQMAATACKRAAELEPGAPILFNPLYLHANVGLGKTHLAQAVAHEAQARGRNVVYLTAEKFMYGFVNSLRAQNAIAFKEALRAIDILIIDDVQFLSGKIIQQEFGHVLNSLLDAGKQVVVAADRAPLDLESLDERLRSRLTGGLCLEIGAFDEELRLSILQARVEAARLQTPDFNVAESVLRYVARVIDTNGRDLEGAVNRLVARVTLTGAPLTIETTEAAIRDLVRMRDPKKVKIEDIQKLVANHYNVSRADLLSARRTASVVRPRQIAMFLSKVLTPRSLPEIGRRFGGRDHTTVLHAVRKIEGLSSSDRALAQDLEFLKRMLTEL